MQRLIEQLKREEERAARMPIWVIVMETLQRVSKNEKKPLE